MHPLGLLDQEFLNNTLRAWLYALAIFAGVFVLLVLLRILVRRRFIRRAARADDVAGARADSLVADLVHRTRYFAFVAVGLAAGSLDLNLPESWRSVIGDVTVVAVALQIALWCDGLITHGVHRYSARHRPSDASDAGPGANSAAVAAMGVGVRVALWVLLGIIALDAMGVRVTTLVAGLGISGVAIALALQSVLGDAFAALSIVLDKPFVIGDDIGVDALRGKVDRIGMKNTRLRATTGEMVIIANADLLKSRIQNFTQMHERTITFTVTLDPTTTSEVAATVPGLMRDILSAQTGVRFVRSHVTLPTERGIGVETVYTVTSPQYLLFAEVQQATTLGLLHSLEQGGIALAKPSGPTIVMQAASPAESPTGTA